MKKKISPGDYVLFYAKGKTWLIRVAEGNDVHLHLGRIRISDVIGKNFGESINTEKGERVFLLRPSIEDFIMKCERLTQIIYPKDLGLIALEADIHAGSRVVEVGSGSGATTTFLASIVRPNGKVFSYEVREDFMRIAERNVRKAALDQFVTFHNKDATLGIEEKELDAAIVDMGDPWVLVKECWRVLKPSGHFVGVTPTMNQAERLTEELKSNSYERVKCVEVLLRNIEARAGKTRPSTMMIGHTAYLVFATKVLMGDDLKGEEETADSDSF